jgi:hypothetical protein
MVLAPLTVVAMVEVQKIGGHGNGSHDAERWWALQPDGNSLQYSGLLL